MLERIESRRADRGSPKQVYTTRVTSELAVEVDFESKVFCSTLSPNDKTLELDSYYILSNSSPFILSIDTLNSSVPFGLCAR
jgi:hypothetical protein